MRKYFAVVAALSCLLPTNGSAFYQAALDRELARVRTPLGTEQTLESDIRLRSMGMLNMAIKDPSNKIGAFTYGGYAAGLTLDYKYSKVETQVFYDSAKVDDNSSVADAFTGERGELKQTSISLTGIHQIPWGCGPGVFGWKKNWEYNDFETSRAAGTSDGLYPNNNDLSSRDFTAAYGHNIKKFLAGLTYEHQLERQEDEFGTFSQDERVYMTEISPSLGTFFLPGTDQRITIVGGPRIIKEESEGTSGSEYDIDGMKIGAGVFWDALGDRFSLGANIDSGELEGDSTSNGTRIGDREVDRTLVQVRTFYRMEGPFSFGAEVWSTERTVKQTNLSGVVLSDRQTDRVYFGLGSAYHFAEDRGLVGIDYRWRTGEVKEETNPSLNTANRDEDGMEISLGAEYALTQKLWLRGGLWHVTDTYKPVGGAPEADADLNQLSLGVGYKMTDRLGLDGALTYSKYENDAVVGVQDETEIQGLGMQFRAQYSFGGAE